MTQTGDLAAHRAALAADEARGRRELAELDAEIAALEAERKRLTERLLRMSGAMELIDTLIAQAGESVGESGDG